MDFDNLPTDIFVHILQYLPLEEQIRIGRVREVNLALSELKKMM